MSECKSKHERGHESEFGFGNPLIVIIRKKVQSLLAPIKYVNITENQNLIGRCAAIQCPILHLIDVPKFEELCSTIAINIHNIIRNKVGDDFEYSIRLGGWDSDQVSWEIQVKSCSSD